VIVSDARLVEAENLDRRFGDIHAVDGVSLHIEAGETYGLLGPNGAGKTTTINILTGLLEPDEGTVTVAGTRIRPGSIAGKSAIGLVPQDLAIYPDLTGEENLRFFASLYGLPRAETRARIDEVLDVIGLADRRKDRTSKYSGGMKRRLNIGIGLLNRPRLLVLDEPTVGVDPQSRNAILESVEALSGEGMAVLYTTHYMEEAQRLCDRVGIIDSGKVIAEGTTQQLVARIGEREQLRIGATGDLDGAADKVRVLDGISEASVEEHTIVVLAEDASRQLPAVIERLSAAGVDIGSIEVARPDLEAVFLHLTGKALRE
jgi:ABC-2 type transport system ATP-binding protein